MKWMLALVAMVLAVVSCSQKKEAPKSKVLVLYYSQTSNTKTVAQEIANKLGADIEEIVAVNPYDGDFEATINRCMQEREKGTKPEIKPIAANLADYDTIFIGYPVWFGTFAPPMAAFLDQADLSGKKIVPFCTFGSGGLNTSVKELAAKQPKAFIEGEYVVLEDFPEQQPVSEEQSAIFDKAVGDYPMIHAKATKFASRAVPGGTEYLFTAVDLPRETTAVQTTPPPAEMQIYVLALEGEDPVFTQVLR